LTHSSSSNPDSTSGVIPQIYRPTTALNFNTYLEVAAPSTYMSFVSIGSDGFFEAHHRDWAGTAVSKTQLQAFTVSFVVTSAIA
jgi:hypothetical protein